MIKTLYLDLAINLLVGLSIPLAARDRVRSGAGYFNRYLCAVLLFELFVFMPVGAYLFSVYAVWTMMYVVDPALYKFLTPISVSCFYLAAALAGYSLAYFACRAGKDKVAVAALVAALLALGAVSLFGIFRLCSVGSFAQWHSGSAMTFILQSPLSRDMAVIVAWFVVVLGAIHWKIRRGW